jgi:hypothetical protein
MGISWGAIAGLLTSISPIIVPLLGGPAGVIIKAAASAVVIVENFVSNHRGEAKQQRALNLVMSLLTVAEDATAKDLMSDPLVARAVEAVIDAEVATRNAHAALAALITDIQSKRDASA